MSKERAIELLETVIASQTPGERAKPTVSASLVEELFAYLIEMDVKDLTSDELKAFLDSRPYVVMQDFTLDVVRELDDERLLPFAIMRFLSYHYRYENLRDKGSLVFEFCRKHQRLVLGAF